MLYFACLRNRGRNGDEMGSTLEGRLQVAGRVIVVVGAAVTLVAPAWYANTLVQGGFFGDPVRGEIGIMPLILLARLVVAGVVVWAIIRLDERELVKILLMFFGVSFLLLYGWYFMILGYDDAIFYVAVSADLLYLAGAIVIGSALALAAIRPRRRNGHLEA